MTNTSVALKSSQPTHSEATSELQWVKCETDETAMHSELQWVKCDAPGCGKWRQLPETYVSLVAVIKSASCGNSLRSPLMWVTSKHSLRCCRLGVRTGSVATFRVAAVPLLVLVAQTHVTAQVL